MIRVLVVDDSAFMRKALSMMLEKDPGVEVLDTARDGEEAIRKVRALRPDVVTMDVEMPRMDGITAVRKIMAAHPLPILMVSSLTKDGAQTTIDALAAGAVDVIAKASSFVSLDITSIEADLLEKVKSVAESRYFNRRTVRQRKRQRRSGGTAPTVQARSARLLAIGLSTGGPQALQRVIPKLPADFPLPVAVVQHMPPHFTRSLANRLDGLSPLEVVEAADGLALKPGRVVIAEGGSHLVFRRGAQHATVRTPAAPTDTLHRPSVDVMFSSAHALFGGDVLAVVMTGMGKDGLAGTRLLKGSGAQVIAQDEATSVVYGMPRAVVEADLADAIVPLPSLAQAIITSVGHRRTAASA